MTKILDTISPKKKGEITRTGKEDLDYMGDIDFLGLTENLVNATVKSSAILSGKPFTPESLQQANTTLGFLNAYLKAYNAKMSFFKLTGVEQKVEMVRRIKMSNKKQEDK